MVLPRNAHDRSHNKDTARGARGARRDAQVHAERHERQQDARRSAHRAGHTAGSNSPLIGNGTGAHQRRLQHANVPPMGCGAQAAAQGLQAPIAPSLVTGLGHYCSQWPQHNSAAEMLQQSGCDTRAAGSNSPLIGDGTGALLQPVAAA